MKPVHIFIAVLANLAISALVAGAVFVYGAPYLEGLRIPAPSSLASEDATVISAIDQASASVVTIVSAKDAASAYDEQSHGFKSGTKLQAGVAFTSDGYILTAKLAGEPTAAYVVFTNDGTEFPATVVATDESAELTVLKVDANGLNAAKLGDSDGLQVGETVLALGNSAARDEHVVTRGVIRELGSQLQTDADIDAGNAGGPLLDLHGDVVGVDVAGAGGVQGFSVPVNAAKAVLANARGK